MGASCSTTTSIGSLSASGVSSLRPPPHCLFALTLLLSCFYPTSAQGLDSLDIRLFRSVNAGQLNGRNGPFEYLDDSAIPTFVAAPVIYAGYGLLGDHSRSLGTGLLLGSSELGALVMTAALKAVIGRPRPFESLSGVRVKHQWSALGASFPSGHAASAFAIATVLSLRYPSTLVAVGSYGWAMLISYGRIYLGVHYPSDVLAGAVLGSGLALLAWQFRPDLDRFAGRVVAPSQRITAMLRETPVARVDLFRWSVPIP